MLHVHGNTKDSEESQWIDRVARSINDIARSEGSIILVYIFKLFNIGIVPLQEDLILGVMTGQPTGYCWEISIEHVERVKWYAPHIRHVVVDVRCRQIQR